MNEEISEQRVVCVAFENLKLGQIFWQWQFELLVTHIIYDGTQSKRPTFSGQRPHYTYIRKHSEYIRVYWFNGSHLVLTTVRMCCLCARHTNTLVYNFNKFVNKNQNTIFKCREFFRITTFTCLINTRNDAIVIVSDVLLSTTDTRLIKPND